MNPWLASAQGSALAEKPIGHCPQLSAVLLNQGRSCPTSRVRARTRTLAFIPARAEATAHSPHEGDSRTDSNRGALRPGGIPAAARGGPREACPFLVEVLVAPARYRVVHAGGARRSSPRATVGYRPGSRPAAAPRRRDPQRRCPPSGNGPTRHERRRGRPFANRRTVPSAAAGDCLPAGVAHPGGVHAGGHYRLDRIH